MGKMKKKKSEKVEKSPVYQGEEKKDVSQSDMKLEGAFISTSEVDKEDVIDIVTDAQDKSRHRKTSESKTNCKPNNCFLLSTEISSDLYKKTNIYVEVPQKKNVKK